MSTMRTEYRPDIDGLRAIAVISVILFHAKITGFIGGFLGVDIFFVISGFLITQQLSTTLAEKGELSLVTFYSRRMRRLLVPMLLVILVVLGLWLLFFLGIPEETNHLVQSVHFSLMGMANLFFKNHSGGYFDRASDEYPLLHFWSLAVEEQFYLFWPLLLQILFPKFHINKTQVFIKRTILVTILLTVVSLIGAFYLLKLERFGAAFYWMPARAWEFGFGALVLFLVPKVKTISRLILNLLSFLGLLLIFVSVFFIPSTNTLHWPVQFPAVIGTALLIFSGSYAN